MPQPESNDLSEVIDLPLTIAFEGHEGEWLEEKWKKSHLGLRACVAWQKITKAKVVPCVSNPRKSRWTIVSFDAQTRRLVLR